MHLRETPVQPAQHGDRLALCPRFQYAIELIGRRWVGAVLRVWSPAPPASTGSSPPSRTSRTVSDRAPPRGGGAEAWSPHRLPDRPIRVTYELTDCGRSLSEIICTIGTWSNAGSTSRTLTAACCDRAAKETMDRAEQQTRAVSSTARRGRSQACTPPCDT